MRVEDRESLNKIKKNMYPEKLLRFARQIITLITLPFQGKIHKLQAKSLLLRDSRIKFYVLLLLLLFMSVFGLAEL